MKKPVASEMLRCAPPHTNGPGRNRAMGISSDVVVGFLLIQGSTSAFRRQAVAYAGCDDACQLAWNCVSQLPHRLGPRAVEYHVIGKSLKARAFSNSEVAHRTVRPAKHVFSTWNAVDPRLQSLCRLVHGTTGVPHVGACSRLKTMVMNNHRSSRQPFGIGKFCDRIANRPPRFIYRFFFNFQGARLGCGVVRAVFPCNAMQIPVDLVAPLRPEKRFT